jgi:hypothetical protein
MSSNKDKHSTANQLGRPMPARGYTASAISFVAEVTGESGHEPPR